MSDKPVEVWIALDDDGNYIDVDLNELTTRKRYHAERRLLVKEGQTFADGVEVAINHLALSGVIKIDGVFAKELRALSPAPEPSEADKLLHDLENELEEMSLTENSARYKGLAKRVQTYLKERG